MSKVVAVLRNAAEVAREAIGSAQEIADVVEEARDAYKRFHWGDEPVEVVEADCPHVEHGDVLVVLGTLDRIDYETVKGETDAIWFHPFEDERPKLAVTRDGRLVIVGGDYRVTVDGIVG